jgi:hypothetical protein
MRSELALQRVVLLLNSTSFDVVSDSQEIHDASEQPLFRAVGAIHVSVRES